MSASYDVKSQGEVHTVLVSGTLDDADLRPLSEKLVAPFGAGAAAVVLDLTAVTALAPTVVTYLYRLNDELAGRGADMVVCRPQGDIPGSPADGSAKEPLRVETNRHVALGELLSGVGTRRQLLAILEKPCALAYAVPARGEATYEASFVRTMQNFLVFRPEGRRDESLARGDRVRVTLTPPGDEREFAFEAEVAKFAMLKGSPSPCFVVRVPGEIEERELRRDPVLPQELKMNFWGISGDKSPRPGMVVALDAGGFRFRTARFDHRPGADIFCDIDFVVAKFAEAPRCRVEGSEFGPMGQVEVTCTFGRLTGRDQGVLDDYLARYCC